MGDSKRRYVADAKSSVRVSTEGDVERIRDEAVAIDLRRSRSGSPGAGAGDGCDIFPLVF